ncbi:hypothetical protein [Ottowia testudinis]|uniref:Scaffolding protein n=1 Tax=Ottowia testudinis TaxID=2816950 RepID=A0A975CGN7_9BURK|nr:hypothetical protein [Ottowia testudinis]QTD44557.1 hypothetical protein J1M35_15870 [Ottowia testudinis]
MNPSLQHHRYLAPAGDEGPDTSGTDAAVVDDDSYASLPIEERRKLRGDDTESAADDAPAAPAPPSDAAAPEPDEGGERNHGAGIPRARFNEVNERRKALEQEVEALRAQLAAGNGSAPGSPPVQQAEALDLQAAEERYGELIMDGDMKAAAALRVRINAAIEEAAFNRFSTVTAHERVQAKVEATVEQLMAEFPWLEQPEGAEAMDLIEASVMLKMSRGTSRDKALDEAVRAIAPRFAPVGTPSRVGQGDGTSGDIRVERANRRGATDSQMQPAAMQAGIGNRSNPAQIDASALSDEEYMKLPEAERKRLRGD